MGKIFGTILGTIFETTLLTNLITVLRTILRVNLGDDFVGPFGNKFSCSCHDKPCPQLQPSLVVMHQAVIKLKFVIPLQPMKLKSLFCLVFNRYLSLAYVELEPTYPCADYKPGEDDLQNFDMIRYHPYIT